jgi:hypothetical protein
MSKPWPVDGPLMLESWSVDVRTTIRPCRNHDLLIIRWCSNHDRLMLESRSVHVETMICWWPVDAVIMISRWSVDIDISQQGSRNTGFEKGFRNKIFGTGFSMRNHDLRRSYRWLHRIDDCIVSHRWLHLIRYRWLDDRTDDCIVSMSVRHEVACMKEWSCCPMSWRL